MKYKKLEELQLLLYYFNHLGLEIKKIKFRERPDFEIKFVNDLKLGFELSNLKIEKFERNSDLSLYFQQTFEKHLDSLPEKEKNSFLKKFKHCHINISINEKITKNKFFNYCSDIYHYLMKENIISGKNKVNDNKLKEIIKNIYLYCYCNCNKMFNIGFLHSGTFEVKIQDKIEKKLKTVSGYKFPYKIVVLFYIYPNYKSFIISEINFNDIKNDFDKIEKIVFFNENEILLSLQ